MPNEATVPDSNGSGKGLFTASATSWVKAVTIIGIPGVIALYLTYVGAQSLPSLQRDIAVNRTEIAKMEDLLRQHLQDQRDTYRVMLRICANTAKSDTERAQCFSGQ